MKEAGENKKEIKEDKKTEEQQESKWKNYFIGMSVLSGVLLIATIALAVRPPEVKYVYDPYSYSSDDSVYDDSDDDLVDDVISPSYSTPSTTNSSETITYASGEKTGTSAVGATIEVEEIIKHYQGYSSYYSSCAPDSGYEYVLVRLNFKNDSANAIKMYSFDFYLKDSDGMMDVAESFDKCYNSGVTIFPFSKEIAGGGTKVSGAMMFPVRKGMTDNLTLLYEKDYPKEKISIDL